MDHKPEDFRVEAGVSIALGKEYRDRITGFQGVAVARAEYIDQPPAAGLQAPCMDTSKAPDTVWFAQSRLKRV